MRFLKIYRVNNEVMSMEAVIVIFSIILLYVMYVFRSKKDRKKIERKVEEMGGKIINIEKSVFEKGPFRFAGKGIMIYKFQYTVKQNGEDITKEAWVKTGGLFGDDWRF
jgi:Ca2+/Na+ antiporter